MKNLIAFLKAFLLFFVIVAFVITCTFLLSFNAVTLPEEDVRTFAPLAFVNVFVITFIFTAVDFIRRKITIDRPVREIQKVLSRLMKGDFSARITLTSRNHNKFGEIADSINLLAEELSGVETLRTDFIANVSHELKTPLAVMQNYGTMLTDPYLPEETRIEYARAITGASRRLADLISNILKLNKLENQQIFPTAAEYNLSEQLCECLLGFEEIWEKKGIEIETDIAEDVTVCADSELLSLAWNNLLSNAFKFTEKGGRVSLSLTAGDYYATVKISDTGCGISPETGAHIFEKFYQGDTSHTAQGNGLGLALVKRVIDITGADISVESVLGKGSTFIVELKRGGSNGSEKASE